jgi:hypothetical protein
MQADVIREHHRRRPFQPIRIHLDDGRVFEVHEPGHMLVGVALVFIGTDIDRRGIPGETVMTDAGHVTNVEVLAKAGG